MREEFKDLALCTVSNCDVVSDEDFSDTLIIAVQEGFSYAFFNIKEPNYLILKGEQISCVYKDQDQLHIELVNGKEKCIPISSSNFSYIKEDFDISQRMWDLKGKIHSAINEAESFADKYRLEFDLPDVGGTYRGNGEGWISSSW